MAKIEIEIGNYISRGKTVTINYRLCHRNQKARIASDLSIAVSDLGPKNEIRNQQIEMAVQRDLLFYREQLIALGRRVESYTAKELAISLEKRQRQSLGIGAQYLDFIAFSKQEIDRMAANGQQSISVSYRSAIRRICEFEKSDELAVSEITAKWLRSFEKWLLNDYRSPRSIKPMTMTGVALYMRRIRALINKMKDEYNDEDKGEIVITNNPFGKYNIPVEVPPKRRALKIEEIHRIMNYQPIGVRDSVGRDMFLLSLALCGMNLVDIYKCTDYHDGRITYERSKTEHRYGGAEFSVKVLPPFDEIVSRYADVDGRRIFGFYKQFCSVNTFTQSVNKGLKTIGKAVGIEGLTHYAARHSFATIAANECGFSLDRIGAALNHVVDKRQAVTERYIKRDNSGVDEVQRAVLDVVL